MKIIHRIASIFVFIGAINWGLWGLFEFDVLGFFFHRDSSFLARTFCTIIGLSGVWLVCFIWKCKGLFNKK